MVAAIACLFIPIKPIDFPERPSPHEIEVGVRTYVDGKGLDRLYREDRQVTGTWFDGRRKREADHVLWISPSMAARWLGYLEAKEKWPDGELEHRWNRLKRELGGRMTFVVRLCAMPRIDPLESEAVERGSTRDAANVRFLWTSSETEWPHVPSREGLMALSASGRPSAAARPLEGLRAEPRTQRLDTKQARNAEGVLREDWWRRVPFGEPLIPEFSECDDNGSLPLGDYYSATYLLQVPIPEHPIAGAQFEVRTFSPRKERIARFSLFDARIPRRFSR